MYYSDYHIFGSKNLMEGLGGGGAETVDERERTKEMSCLSVKLRILPMHQLVIYLADGAQPPATSITSSNL